MNDVNKLLKTRCEFDFKELFTLGNLEKVHIMPKSMLKMGFPEDFTNLYQKYNGGHQNFTAHGWPTWQGPIVLRLFGLEEMPGRTMSAREHAEKALSANCASEEIGWLKRNLYHVKLRRMFQKMLIIGEIAPLTSSGIEALTTFIIFSGSCFFTATMEDFVTIGFQSSADWLARQCARENVISDETMYGMLNKLLNIILKDKKTIFELREAQKAQQRLAREERSRPGERKKTHPAKPCPAKLVTI